MLNKFIPIVLAASMLLTPMPVLASLSQQHKRVLALLSQQPWDKQQLRKIVTLSLAHEHLLSAKPQDWKQRMQAFEADPDFIHQAKQVFIDIILSLPFADNQVEKLLLWKMIDPQGKQHWLFGTVHHLTFANFTPEARTQLEKTIDATSAILHENVPLDSIELAQALLDSMDYDAMIDKLVQLDVQIITRGIYRHKNILALEDGYDRHVIRHNLADASRAAPHLSDTQEVPLEQLEQEAADIIEKLEQMYVVLTAYLTANASMMNTAEIITPSMLDDDINDRNHLWLDRIITQCEQNDSCLIIAGHAHMTTDNENLKSIITLLREHGFIIERVE